MVHEHRHGHDGVDVSLHREHTMGILPTPALCFRGAAVGNLTALVARIGRTGWVGA
jgi:hypothetical protein